MQENSTIMVLLSTLTRVTHFNLTHRTYAERQVGLTHPGSNRVVLIQYYFYYFIKFNIILVFTSF